MFHTTDQRFNLNVGFAVEDIGPKVGKDAIAYWDECIQFRQFMVGSYAKQINA